MLWKNKKLGVTLCTGHYEINQKTGKRDFHIMTVEIGKKSKTFKFTSPQAAKKAGWEKDV